MQTQDISEDGDILRTVHIPQSDDQALREIAQEEGRTVPGLIREACMNSFAVRKKS